ncbi:MAG: hypothetical protein V4463_20030 [Pseudomonadota bacterium]
MRILALVQAVIAAAFLLLGLVALFGIGITGLIFLVPGAVFAAIAGVVQGESRAAVVLALAADALLAFIAANKLQALLKPALGVLPKPGWLDFMPPCATLLLFSLAVVAVLLDWRAVRASPWF